MQAYVSSFELDFYSIYIIYIQTGLLGLSQGFAICLVVVLCLRKIIEKSIFLDTSILTKNN